MQDDPILQGGREPNQFSINRNRVNRNICELEPLWTGTGREPEPVVNRTPTFEQL